MILNTGTAVYPHAAVHLEFLIISTVTLMQLALTMKRKGLTTKVFVHHQYQELEQKLTKFRAANNKVFCIIRLYVPSLDSEQCSPNTPISGIA